jgi:hypothetical protein
MTLAPPDTSKLLSFRSRGAPATGSSSSEASCRLTSRHHKPPTEPRVSTPNSRAPSSLSLDGNHFLTAAVANGGVDVATGRADEGEEVKLRYFISHVSSYGAAAAASLWRLKGRGARILDFQRIFKEFSKNFKSLALRASLYLPLHIT